jgi:hypothetical protein
LTQDSDHASGAGLPRRIAAHSPQYVIAAYAATASITFFAAALAVLISTFARRVGQAVLIVYVMEIGWLVVPPVVDAVCRWLFPQVYLWVGPLSDWVGATTPVSLLIWNVPSLRWFFLGMAGGIPTPVFDQFLWMIGLQFGLAVLFLLIAAWQLRPTFRRQEESRRRVAWFSNRLSRVRWLNRPECGADAMLWKESHFARTDVFTASWLGNRSSRARIRDDGHCRLCDCGAITDAPLRPAVRRIRRSTARTAQLRASSLDRCDQCRKRNSLELISTQPRSSTACLKSLAAFRCLDAAANSVELGSRQSAIM